MFKGRDQEKDKTFLKLKYGEDYKVKIIERWHNSKDLLTDAENKVCYDYLLHLASTTRGANWSSGNNASDN